jgi:hypothetical protein
VFEEVIKQMKRLQNPRMVDGDDRNDMENMEDMEYQDEDENHVLKTMENMEDMEYQDEDENHVLKTMEDMEYRDENENHVLKTMEDKMKIMCFYQHPLDYFFLCFHIVEAMATHENLAKNFFESNLKKKKKKQQQHCLPRYI